LTLYLALHFAGPLVAMGTIFYILWHNLWNAWQMYVYDKRKLEKKSRKANAGA
jgi:BASS family bile acid:Na+ symporter